MEITNEQVIEAYEQGKKVFANKSTLGEAKLDISGKTAMNEGSAQGYVHTFRKAGKGQVYKLHKGHCFITLSVKCVDPTRKE